MTLADPRCGTSAGHQAHRARGETPCGPCLRAHADYHKALRARNPKIAAAQKRQKKIRARALAALALRHPDEYNALFTEEARRMGATS